MQTHLIEPTSRDSQIDVLRGIGCIFVILGHLHPGGWLETHIYSFHMFLFFFLSGYLYKKKPIKFVLTSNCKRLFFPFLCVGGVAEIISLLLAEPIEGGAIPALFYYKGMLTWNRPIWFLLVLLEATIITHMLECFSRIYYLSIAASFLLGFLLQNTNYSFGLSILPVAYSWIGIGYLSRKYLKSIFDARRKYWCILFLTSATLNFCFSYLLNTRISMVGSYYGNYIYAFIAGFFGITMYWYLSKWICNSTVLETFGQHGVFLITTQYIIFRFLSAITKRCLSYDIWKEVNLSKAIVASIVVCLLYWVLFALGRKNIAFVSPKKD